MNLQKLSQDLLIFISPILFTMIARGLWYNNYNPLAYCDHNINPNFFITVILLMAGEQQPQRDDPAGQPPESIEPVIGGSWTGNPFRGSTASLFPFDGLTTTTTTTTATAATASIKARPVSLKLKNGWEGNLEDGRVEVWMGLGWHSGNQCDQIGRFIGLCATF